jgi:hypothetical protein
METDNTLDLDDLGISFAKLAEAVCIEENIPCKRKFTHAELADALRAVREINEAKARNKEGR